jgi:hypothetical protein
MVGSQSVEQLVLRDNAAKTNPEFATLEGRALQDVRDTIAYLAVGLKPETVLGGLMLSQFGLFDSTLVSGNDRGAIEIGVKGSVDPMSPNDKGDTVTDVLEGLCILGFAEKVYTPNTVEALLLPKDDHHRIMDYPTYRLAGKNLPPKVLGLVESITAISKNIDADNDRRAAKKALPRKGFLRRRNTT